MNDRSLPERLAFEMARWLRLHLLAELKKPSRVVDYITVEGVSFRAYTEAMLRELSQLFPALEAAPPAPLNVFKIMWESRGDHDMSAVDHGAPYEEATFKTANAIFLLRIQDLINPTKNLFDRMHAMMAPMAKGIARQGRRFGFQGAYLSATLSFLAEEQALRHTDLPFEEARRILFDQTVTGHLVMHNVLDDILNDSLRKSERLLEGLLPKHAIAELKDRGEVAARTLPEVAVMFCDLTGFTSLAGGMEPNQLLAELDRCFSHLERIVNRHGLEKIKTIGDSFMAASSPEGERPPAVRAAYCALRIQDFMRSYRSAARRRGLPEWHLRIGIHLGPVVAGVIGRTRYHYDIWGDTVNVAQRMEANGEPDQINISSRVARAIGDTFELESRGRIPVKGIGPMEMFFVRGVSGPASVAGHGHLLARGVPS